MKMSVFHVFFLVFLMLAVHSHERAYEAESIVYNNTHLPYKENMNAETVIDSKIVPYNYFYLVFHWPRTYCAWDRVSCVQPIPNWFTVHGLWPQLNGVSYYITCNEAIRQLRITRDLENQLNTFWPNLLSRVNAAFWEYEFARHGSCFGLNQEEYFQRAVQISNCIPQLNEKLASRGIREGYTYVFDDLQQRIKSATGFYPKLECDHRGRLYQMYFCATASAIPFHCHEPLVPINSFCGPSVYIP